MPDRPTVFFDASARRFRGPSGFVAASTLGGHLQEVERAVLVSVSAAIQDGPAIAIQLQKDQLREGVNSLGQQMPGYSPKYAKRRKGGRVRPRSIVASGSTVGAMVGESRGPMESAVVFAGVQQEEIAKHNHFGTSRGMPATFWFGLNPASEQRLARQIDNLTRRGLPRGGPPITRTVTVVL